MKRKGTVTISIEIELAWGAHDLGVFSHLSKDRRAEDIGLSRLLEKCEDKNIPMTFDVVGHLLLRRCDGYHGKKYGNKWWSHDPGTSENRNPLFYAPTLIRKIEESSVEHEIATHTFSHIDAERFGKKVVKGDIEKSIAAHRDFGLCSPKSIVMPRHKKVDRQILKDNNIRVIRRPDKNYNINRAKRWFRLITQLKEPRHRKCSINKEGEITITTCHDDTLSARMLPQGQREVPHYYRAIPKAVRERAHTYFLIEAFETAAESECHIHLWTHLFNISNDSQWRAIEPALDTLGKISREKNVEIKRMRDLQL